MRRIVVAALLVVSTALTANAGEPPAESSSAAEQGETRPAIDYDAYRAFVRQRYGFSSPSQAAPAPATTTTEAEPEPSEIARIMEACDGIGGVDWLACVDRESPERCRQMIYQKDRRPWALCVSGCNGAGLWRRTMGDCAR